MSYAQPNYLVRVTSQWIPADLKFSATSTQKQRPEQKANVKGKVTRTVQSRATIEAKLQADVDYSFRAKVTVKQQVVLKAKVQVKSLEFE